ncbi:MAG TPA: hemerythrin domain-containing protein [Flavipsychrobacter sp.]|nr:hemerythrin domain-containing protein [Flavipsychrobacter sp.]
MWEHHLQQHFQEEEAALFSRIRDRLCTQALEEHLQIKQLITATELTRSAYIYTILADLVDDHIRFEERTLFPHLEKILPAETLASTGKLLQEAHTGKHTDDYADEFGNSLHMTLHHAFASRV